MRKIRRPPTFQSSGQWCPSRSEETKCGCSLPLSTPPGWKGGWGDRGGKPQWCPPNLRKSRNTQTPKAVAATAPFQSAAGIPTGARPVEAQPKRQNQMWLLAPLSPAGREGLGESGQKAHVFVKRRHGSRLGLPPLARVCPEGRSSAVIDQLFFGRSPCPTLPQALFFPPPWRPWPA